MGMRIQSACHAARRRISAGSNSQRAETDEDAHAADGDDGWAECLQKCEEKDEMPG